MIQSSVTISLLLFVHIYLLIIARAYWNVSCRRFSLASFNRHIYFNALPISVLFDVSLITVITRHKILCKQTHMHSLFVPLRNDYDVHKFMTWKIQANNKQTYKKTTSDSVQINYELYACLVEWHKFHSFFETRASFENTNLCTYLDHLRRLMLNQTFTFNYWKTVSILIHFHQWEKIAKIEAFQVDIIHFFLSLKILPFFSHLIFFAFKFFPS